MSKKKWKHLSGNSVLEGDKDFYISYNLLLLPAVGFSSFASDNNSEETALVNSKSKIQFRILNGDFRKDYEKIIDKGWKSCLSFYNSKKKLHNSSWTG